jgi:solute carrier family 30 (zinc transporter), member 5/7
LGKKKKIYLFFKFVSFAGLCVNLIGIFAFTHAHTHGGAPCSSTKSDSKSHGHSYSHDTDHHHHSHQHNHAHSHSQTSTTDNDNMRGVYLHILADTMGSVGVIISSFLLQQFGWFIADPLCSMFIAIMIFLSVRPLIKHSAMVLMLRTPNDKEASFKQALTRILSIEGVISYRDDHLWQLSSSSYVTTLHVLIEQNSYEQLIGSQVQSILKDLKISNVTVQLEKEVYFQHLMGLGMNPAEMNDFKRKYQSNKKNSMPSIDNSQKFI